MRLMLVAVTSLVLASCCVRCSPEQKSYVDVPAKLDDVKALASPPDVVVSVERKLKGSGGGGACGHSAACVILLPLIVYELAFPEKYDEVTVTTKGETTFHGLYSTSGDLLSARTKTDDGWRELAQLDLPELGQRAIVERAKVVTSDGGEARTPTTIQSQVDLVAQYRAMLAKRTGEKRGRLLSEASSRLDGEGDAFVLEQLVNADEPDESRARVIRDVCGVTVREGATSKVPTLVPAAMTHPSVEVAKATLECASAPEGVVKTAATFLTAKLCDAKNGGEARTLAPTETFEHRPVVTAGIDDAIKACTPEGAVIARLALGEAVSTEAWLAALRSARGDTVISLTNPNEKALLVAALEADVRTSEVLVLAGSGRFTLTEREARVFVQAALRTKRDAAGWSARAGAAMALSDAQSTRPALQPLLSGVSKPDQRTAQVFQAMMGDTVVRDALADTLPPGTSQRFLISSIGTEDELVLQMLLERGCRAHDLSTGHKSGACH